MIEQPGRAVAEGATATTELPAGRAITVSISAPAARTRPKLRPYELTYLWFSRIVIVGFIALILVPVLLVIQASFTSGQSFNTFSWLPDHPTLEHYQRMFDLNQVNFVYWMRNSAIVCLSTAAVSVLLVASTGYAFSRFHFRGRKYGLMAMLLIQMFPVQMSFLAFYFLLNKVNLLNTLGGLALVYIGGGVAFNSWLFKGFVDGLPRDLEESAYVDGATPWQAFYKIILPLTRPMMAVIFIFVLIGNFNEYILASWLLRDSDKLTMAVGLRGFINGAYQQNWTDFAAAAILGSIPILIIFLIAQRWLVSGLAAGAVKG